jgi:murein DD-endopeptidase MepM/ murein hydrolase activator NlpD
MQSSFTKQPGRTLGDGSPAKQEDDGPSHVGSLSLVTSSGLTFFGQKTQVVSLQLGKLTGNPALMSRTLAHTMMLVVALLVIVLSRLDLSWGRIKAIRPLLLTPVEAPQTITEEQSLPFTLPGELINTQDGVLVRAAVPKTIIPDRGTIVQPNQDEIRTYTVESGDTISGIAARFGLLPETLIWANPDLEQNPHWLSIGQQVRILPVDGVYHQVGGSDTVEAIAGTYDADPQAIISHPLNKLDAENPVIQIGQWLIVPGGRKPFIPQAVTAYSGPIPEGAIAGSGIFGWPASGSISNGFFSYHPAIDIAAWIGAPVQAADSGYVVVAGWDNLYGYHIVIDHGNGFQTLYAHLNSYYVDAGVNVAKGEQIGEMGSTGNSTGPHLHFEVRDGTVQMNPYGFLP